MASKVITTNISKCIIGTQSFCNCIFVVRLMSMIRDSWWTCTRPVCPAHQDLIELGKERVPHDSRHVARQGVGAMHWAFSMPIKARQVSPFISLWWTIDTLPKGGSRNGGIQNLVHRHDTNACKCVRCDSVHLQTHPAGQILNLPVSVQNPDSKKYTLCRCPSNLESWAGEMDRNWMKCQIDKISAPAAHWQVEAAKLHDGDTLTLVMVSRDPRAEDWVSRVPRSRSNMIKHTCTTWSNQTEKAFLCIFHFDLLRHKDRVRLRQNLSKPTHRHTTSRIRPAWKR